MYNEQYLEHFGIKGMKWGVRRAKKESYRSDKGPKRWLGTNDAANSAARTYYRSERTGNFRTYRKAKSKLDLKMASLTKEQIDNGRYRVARARNIRRKALSTVVGTAAGAAAISSGAGFAGLMFGVGTGVATNFASGGRYYSKQKRAYGGRRAKYEQRVEDRKKING